MKLLAEILRKEGIDITGRTIYREAVRGIVIAKRELLMVYSSINGDFKFPGGGVGPDETHEEALVREMKEECGATVSSIEDAFGKVIEYDLPEETDYDVFMMTSYYYLCKVDAGLAAQNLDQYEAELDFKPKWIDIDVAIRTNKSIIDTGSAAMPYWTKRETLILKQIKQQLFL
jgi:8-oxo-dGTP pyrophosphatase MutT (NUDIX family)